MAVFTPVPETDAAPLFKALGLGRLKAGSQALTRSMSAPMARSFSSIWS